MNDLFINVSTNHGKNFLPRLAGLVDSAIITEVSQVIAPDTFKRPMYAGNAIATVKMSDAVKVCVYIYMFMKCYF